MKSRKHVFGVVLIGAIAAGCSSGQMGSAPSVLPEPAAATAPAAFTMSANAAGPCKRRGGCPAHLVLPLLFDGKSLKADRTGACRRIGVGSARPFTARSNREFSLNRSVTIPASCAGLVPPSSNLFIAVGVRSKNATLPFAPLAGPVNPAAKSWTFNPVATGVGMHAREKFVFFVVAVPSDETNVSGEFRLLAPMSFDGTNFTVAGTCSSDVNDAPLYVAPASGPLTLAANVSVAPTCAPDASESPAPQLYIVAVPAPESSSSARRSSARKPMDNAVSAIAVAGPVNPTDDPWSFAPATPGLAMQAGTGYAFFIAAMAPGVSATPAPPQSYHALVPLNFDGTAFTVASIASCDNLTAPAAYTPAATAPLTLSGAVTIAPTCVPSPAPSESPEPNDDGGNSSAPLYVVATVATFDGESGDALRASDQGGGVDSIDGIAIAGPVNLADNPWSFTPLVPALTLTQGLQYQFYVASRNGDH